MTKKDEKTIDDKIKETLPTDDKLNDSQIDYVVNIKDIPSGIFGLYKGVINEEEQKACIVIENEEKDEVFFSQKDFPEKLKKALSGLVDRKVLIKFIGMVDGRPKFDVKYV